MTQNSVPRAKLSFNSGEIITFSDKQKLRKFAASRPSLQEMLKEIQEEDNIGSET
jgi:DNA invertase Pin-like site-specific DNA recombinase